MYSIIETIVGCHDDAIRCVEYCPEVNVIVTAGWDATVKLWDPRTSRPVSSSPQPAKVWPVIQSTDEWVKEKCHVQDRPIKKGTCLLP